MTLCVFCGSSSGNHPAYLKAATDLGSLLSARNIELVYGGASIGLMGAVELVADKQTKRKFPPLVKETLRRMCQERGLILRATGATESLCFSPPLVITEKEIDYGVHAIAKAVRELKA